MRIREAAVEAQRQRELFTKQPKRSYSNLNRTQSGLLTALLNPDPNLLPQNHPYRSNSTADLARLQHHRGASSATPAPQPLTSSKSSAALPTTAQVNAQAPRTNGDNGTRGGGYRPKGRPQGEDMEDDSDSGDENPDDTIQVSHSLAQQKLAALADPNRRRNSDRGQAPAPREVLPTLPTVATAPIPLNHPWNLPAPAAPSTPRTTRRQMLATELSESLRRNLLWERQVSKTSMMGPTAQYRRGSGLLGNGLRPLTSTTQAQGTQQAQGHRSGDEADDKDERKRRAMARNRSWADDYHYSGW
ncbi:hypothetical protein FA95DRAFT_1658490 [Auriscalpium vulgare]|uniref:Uncharacterized protein n=1 Tax=Auriscalpium vulgare TaxID=40419 RepID=A0ACB8R4K2_9AGAM|nr:hypothetical protein FA95DRAFT_1658490 [Auriscalpium vulgare]